MALVGLLLARDLSGNLAVMVAIGASAAVCALFFMLIASRRAGAGLSGILIQLPSRLGELGGRVVDSLQRYARFTPQLVNVLFCSVAVQVLRIVQAYFLGQGLGITAPLEAYFAFIPLILIVMLLPVTINGIGTSQAGFVWLFARAGVSAPQAFALSVLFVALGIVGNLPGGLLFALGEGRDASSAGAPRR